MARILLIEPARILAKTYQSALTAAGHSVMHHTNAQTAIHRADHHVPDLVIVELQLAKHNGVDFLYEFRSYNDWQHIPIVILSVVPPHEAGLGKALWQHLNIAAYCYKPHTSLDRLVAAANEFAVATIDI